MTAATDCCKASQPAGAAAPCIAERHSVVQRLDAARVLCRMLAGAGASLCLAAPVATAAWQAPFLAGLAMAAASGQRAAALAGAASAVLLIAAPFIGAMSWGTVAPGALEWVWRASGLSDNAPLRTIAVLAIIVLAGSSSPRAGPGVVRC